MIWSKNNMHLLIVIAMNLHKCTTFTIYCVYDYYYYFCMDACNFA